MRIGAMISGPRAAGGLSCAAVIAGMMLAGCAGRTTNGDRQFPTQPAEVVASRMTISAALPSDTDLNGYPDTIDLTIFVFDDRYPIPIDVPGSFVFKLSTSKDATLLRQWEFTPEQARAALRRLPPGPGYLFSLSLIENGDDHIESQYVDLTAEFLPSKGASVRMRGGSTLRLGKLTQ